MSQDTNPQQLGLKTDIQSFQLCQLCLRIVPLLLIQGYLLYLYIRELLKLDKSIYDRMDVAMFVISGLNLFIDICSALIYALGISQISLVTKLVWSFMLYLMFLRFVFRRQQSIKIFLSSILVCGLYFALSIFFSNLIPIRFSLLLICLSITLSSIHQCFFINQLLTHQQAQKIQSQRLIKRQELQVQLLDSRKQYQHRILSSQVKYHLYLRRSFCIAMTATIWISYFFLWNLEDSRNSIGQFFVVFLVQILPIFLYYFFTCASQWLVQQPDQTQSIVQLTQFNSIY